MKIDTIRFISSVRIDGNEFILGVSTKDRENHWELKVELQDRVVLIRSSKAKYKGQTFVVPFENIAVMRLAEDVPEGTSLSKAAPRKS